MANKIELGKLIIGNIKLSKLMKNAYKNYLEIEKSIEKRLEDLNYNENIVFPNKNLSFIESYKKNFFTFLMLSILENMKIKKGKILKYGEIIFCLRTIITSTDNMIDNENKGVIILKNIENHTVNNTLLILTMQNVLNLILKELKASDSTMSFILNKIYSVAKSESQRDSTKYSKYPNPEYVINEIHKGIGGELLQLSLWVPSILESDKELVNKYNDSLFDIGMALQGLDDLCDMEEDFKASQVNLGISKLIYEFNIDKDNFYNKIDFKSLSREYSEMHNLYVKQCIKTALQGFEKLNHLDYPISKKDSVVLLKYLFELRGIKELWDSVDYKI